MRIGFLGLGRMGSIMASRLAESGHDVTAWNRTVTKTASVVDSGGRACATPREAVAEREFVITMLADPQAVNDVFFGENGAADGLANGTVVAEMSTIGPAAVTALRERLPATTRLVDAPVLGSLPQASAGELRIFLGGSEEDVAACQEPLRPLGTPHHVGPLGDGAAMKLVLNMATVTSIVMVGEALALADRLGLGSDATLDALSGTPVGALVSRMRDRVTGSEPPPTSFALGLAEKDLRLALEEGGREDGVLAAAQARLADAGASGRNEQDISAVIGFLRRH